MNKTERVSFATRAHSLCSKEPDIYLKTITVEKKNVQPHIRGDCNKLYNYMIRLLLIEDMINFEQVTFSPDPRSIKVESGNSLHDYLQTTIWFDCNSSTTLITMPLDSASSKSVQFADMLSGAVQSHFEDGNSKPHSILLPKLSCKTLFFTH